MAFLSASHNLPPVATLILDFLSSENSTPTRSELTEMLCPSRLVGPAGKADGVAGAFATEHTLSELEGIGAITFDRATKRVRLRVDHTPGMARHTFHRALFTTQGPEIWRTEGNDWSETASYADLLRAATWLAAQDPIAGPLGFGTDENCVDAESLQFEEFRARKLPMLISNTTAWDNFVRWMVFLGFGIKIPSKRSSYIQPDGTTAVSEAIRKLKPGAKITARRLLDEIAKQFPVMGGTYAAAYATQVLSRTPPFPSSFLSHALLIMDATGAIKLINEADAPDAITISDGEERKRFTHVLVGGTHG